MNLDSPAWVWLSTVLLALVSGAAVVASALLERSGPIRLRHFTEEAGGALEALGGSPVRFEAFRYLLSFAAKVLFGAFVLSLLMALSVSPVSRAAAIGFTGGGIAVFALLIEWLNRHAVGRDPETLLRRFTSLYRISLLLWSPFLPLASRLIPRPEPDEPLSADDEDEASEGEIEAFIAVGEREGILEAEQGDMVRGLVDLGETQVRSVMTPRVDMICAPADSRLEELARVAIEARRSRIPLYEGSIDQIVGVLHVRDLLRGLVTEPRPRALDLSKPPYFVPPTKPADELMRELRTPFQRLAIVLDEYGGVAGLVTLEDLLEEIVGEIVDEHEEVHEEPHRLEDGTWVVEGRMHVDDLAHLVGVEIEEGPYETVGGLVLTVFGEVPLREFGNAAACGSPFS